MKHIILTLLACCMIGTAAAQVDFAGKQIATNESDYADKIADLNYADDGQAYHTLDLYLPKNRQGKCPVVIHIYGSAWYSNSGKGHADLGTIVKALLKAGYAVACPNHRSSADAAWPAQCHDIKAAIRFLRGNAKKYGLDARYIATSGFSSGAHLSSCMAATSGTKKATVGKLEVDLEGSIGKYTKQSSRIFAAISWSGPIDMEQMDCAGKRNMKNTPEEALLRAPLTKENHDLYFSLSPIAYLDRKDPPVLVFHGNNDQVVPYCQGVEWAAALYAAGNKTEFVQVEGGGHGFGGMYSDENLNHMVQFLNNAK